METVGEPMEEDLSKPAYAITANNQATGKESVLSCETSFFLRTRLAPKVRHEITTAITVETAPKNQNESGDKLHLHLANPPPRRSATTPSDGAPNVVCGAPLTTLILMWASLTILFERNKPTPFSFKILPPGMLS
jgi:hypothetical protein